MSENINTENNKPAKTPSPAYFLSLTVENIRCFSPKQTLDLSDGKGRPAPWTIILGDNGFGKTTLLQCLCLVQPQLNPYDSYDNFKNESRLSNVFGPRFISGRPVEAYDFIKSIQNYPAQIRCSISYGGDLSSEKRPRICNNFGVEVTNQNLEITGADLSKGVELGELICYGYGATRRMGEGKLRITSIDDNTTSLFERSSLINAEEWYLQTDYAAHRSKTSKAKRQREQVRQALIDLLPDVEDIRIGEGNTESSGARVEVKTPFGWVHIQSLSLGYRTLIAWVVDLAHRLFERYPNSKNPLAEPAVVLVDEIDLHLHPRFQRKLMDYLTDLFPNTQFIATAHSPLVVQAASNANIALLRREGDHVVIDNDVESIAKWRIDQILTSELFGLESARPPQQEALIKEQTKILSKSKLTKADEARLKQLENEIGELPTGETPEDIKAMDIIHRAAALLEKAEAKS